MSRKKARPRAKQATAPRGDARAARAADLERALRWNDTGEIEPKAGAAPRDRMSATQRVVVVVAVGLAAWWGFHAAAPWMALNKGRYLLNQGRWEEARAHLEAANARYRMPAAAGTVLATALLNLNRPDEAARILRTFDSDPTGESLWLSAAAAYAAGHDGGAAGFLDHALMAQAPLAPGSLPATLAMLGVSDGADWPLGRWPGPKFAETAGLRGSPLERRMAAGLGARAAFAAGRLAECQRLADRAAAAQDRNRRTMTLGCAAAALRGDFARAALFADRDPDRGGLLKDVADLAWHAAARWRRAPAATASAAMARRDAAADATRAMAWAALARAAYTPDTTACANAARHARRVLTSESPGDPAARLLLSDALARDGRTTEALAALDGRDGAGAADGEPPDDLPTRLRRLELSGRPDVMADQVSSGAAAGTPPRARDWPTTAGAATADGAFVPKPGVRVAVPFAVPRDGRYHLAIAARARRSAGLAPLAAVYLDGTRREDQYFDRPGAEAYGRDVTLDRGAHLLELEYLNEAERPVAGETRHLEYLGVVVSPAPGE